MTESGPDNIDKSDQKLCMMSSDLKLFPRSVVTFTLFQEQTGVKPKILARRHYFMLTENEYGRRQSGQGERPLVVFNRGEKTVFLGFLSSEGKKFYYAPAQEPPVVSQVGSKVSGFKTAERAGFREVNAEKPQVPQVKDAVKPEASR